jgi:hypothetical protein
MLPTRPGCPVAVAPALEPAPRLRRRAVPGAVPQAADVVPGWLSGASVGPAARPVPRAPQGLARSTLSADARLGAGLAATAVIDQPRSAAVPFPADLGPVVLAYSGTGTGGSPGGPVAAPRLSGPALPVAVMPDGQGGHAWAVLDHDGGVLARGTEDRDVVALRAAKAAAAALSPPDLPDGLTATEIARLLGLAVETARSWEARGRLVRIPGGGRPRYRLADVLAAEAATRATGQIPGRPSRLRGQRW